MFQRAKQEYNFVLVHPDRNLTGSWTSEANVEDMKAEFKGWEPRYAKQTQNLCMLCKTNLQLCRVQKLLGFVKHSLDWKLMDCPSLPKWVHESNKLTLIGDACHPMLVRVSLSWLVVDGLD